MKPRKELGLALPRTHALGARYASIRARSLRLVEPLSIEDCALQSMPQASPPKWHLAHTTWFFEQFVLARFASAGGAIDPKWTTLYNSYYDNVGPQFARPQRGLLSRPSLAEVLDYRAEVDERVATLIDSRADDREIAARIELGLQHEQQHQELLLTDVKHALSLNPLAPAYDAALPTPPVSPAIAIRFVAGVEGRVEIGADGTGFAFDNETPRHAVLLAPHALANRLVTNAEFRAFVEDGGYRDPRLWLSDGWATAQREGWARPLYWDADLERGFTLGGMRALDGAAPVCHVSYFEADAYARWAGARLPTETEWEASAASLPVQGNFADAGVLEPRAATRGDGALAQMFGDCWEWTASAYLGYPGYRPLAGALGEYNGKFMSGQMVLRGGSCATPAGHVRATYRNFFAPHERWQFMGIRLARDP